MEQEPEGAHANSAAKMIGMGVKMNLRSQVKTQVKVIEISNKIKNEPDEKKKWAMYMQYINEKKYGSQELPVARSAALPH